MEKPKITIMCGLPRSGKSTWVKEHKVKGEVVISADDLRLLVYGQRFFDKGEPLVWAVRGHMMEYLMRQGINIIVDETNTTKERRASIIKLAKTYGYYITGYVISHVSPNICRERAANDGQYDLLPIIDRMADQFELPNKKAEGFDELCII